MQRGLRCCLQRAPPPLSPVAAAGPQGLHPRVGPGARARQDARVDGEEQGGDQGCGRACGRVAVCKKPVATPPRGIPPPFAGFCEVFNLGTGRPSSVLEVITAFRAASGQEIPYEVGPRRPGDAPASFADPAKARSVLGWDAALTMTDMCQDSWRWVSKNPLGYGAPAAGGKAA